MRGRDCEASRGCGTVICDAAMNDETTPPSVFRIRDPRLERIRERLARLVGPGPAANFRDACRAMEAPARFLSTTNLVSHLLREIEGALRDVLAPMPSEAPQPRESRRAQLTEILADHRVDPSSELAVALGPLVEVRKASSVRPNHKEQVRAIASA